MHAGSRSAHLVARLDHAHYLFPVHTQLQEALQHRQQQQQQPAAGRRQPSPRQPAQQASKAAAKAGATVDSSSSLHADEGLLQRFVALQKVRPPRRPARLARE
jgi:hypothetical protein